VGGLALYHDAQGIQDQSREEQEVDGDVEDQQPKAARGAHRNQPSYGLVLEAVLRKNAWHIIVNYYCNSHQRQTKGARTDAEDGDADQVDCGDGGHGLGQRFGDEEPERGLVVDGLRAALVDLALLQLRLRLQQLIVDHCPPWTLS
jgi:hypothetical protein